MTKAGRQLLATTSNDILRKISLLHYARHRFVRRRDAHGVHTPRFVCLCCFLTARHLILRGKPSDLIRMRMANGWQNIVFQNKSTTLGENLLLGLVREIISSFPCAVLLPTEIDEEMNAQIQFYEALLGSKTVVGVERTLWARGERHEELIKFRFIISQDNLE